MFMGFPWSIYAISIYWVLPKHCKRKSWRIIGFPSYKWIDYLPTFTECVDVDIQWYTSSPWIMHLFLLLQFQAHLNTFPSKTKKKTTTREPMYTKTNFFPSLPSRFPAIFPGLFADPNLGRFEVPVVWSQFISQVLHLWESILSKSSWGEGISIKGDSRDPQ